jgi:hypothetical protein
VILYHRLWENASGNIAQKFQQKKFDFCAKSLELGVSIANAQLKRELGRID